MKYILYNPISGNGLSTELANKINDENGGNAKLVNLTELDNYAEFFSGTSNEDEIILLGGDGTLNKFINNIDGLETKSGIYYLPTGTGNDFATDVGGCDATEPFSIDKYIKNLPTVTVKGKSYKFINGVGYGIDGYCCEIGDKYREANKVANYTMIAIKGLLFHYKPTNATVTVDGVTHEYKKVWIAPTMIGKHYGGGMIPTPDQTRDNPEKISLLVFHGSSKLKTLMIFPSLFKGEHVKHTKYVDILEGKSITVAFDEPRPLQIDGETVLDVTEYTATI